MVNGVEWPPKTILAFDFVYQNHVVDAAGLSVRASSEVGAADDDDAIALYGVFFTARPNVDVTDEFLHIEGGKSSHGSYTPVQAHLP